MSLTAPVQLFYRLKLMAYMKFNNIHEGCEVKDNFNYLQTSWSYAYNAVLNGSSFKIFKFLTQAELTT
jgi:hypothetical protein